MAEIVFYPELLAHYRKLINNDKGKLPVCGGEATAEHLNWMLNELENNHEQSLTKKHRWLGFIQGVVIVYGLTSVQSERDITRAVFSGA